MSIFIGFIFSLLLLPILLARLFNKFDVEEIDVLLLVFNGLLEFSSISLEEALFSC